MNFLNPLPGLNPIVIMLILLWSMLWKTLALWRASKGDQRYWFIALLLLNTFGLLELIYLFKFAKIKLTLEDLKKGNFLP
ncbi:MAG: hypothetical protein ACD_37C00097G0002 [uncultured bacterium]|nr:MAG: hypothetical protein ACD_37C00097G0002 [uncultured bacterium]